MSSSAAPIPRPASVPAEAFVMPLRVRSYEVTATGVTSLGTILRYLEHLATRASAARGFDHLWYERAGAAWVVHEMDLLLSRLPGIDDELMMATWVSEFRRVQAHREYAIWRAADQRLVARARARWAYVDRFNGRLTRLPDELVARFGVVGRAMSLRDLAVGTPRQIVAGGEPRAEAVMELTARGYECDTQQHVNNTVYADWLSEALEQALHLRAFADGARCPRYLRVEYVRPVLAGAHVAIATSLTAYGSRALHASQTITDAVTGEVSVRAVTRLLAMSRMAGEHGERDAL
ncbi:MAG TPA: acyl-ACP thioesterase domain-containing protein [Ktedonobacterales bacterium]|nr:acyl-ACP thioesterase domain-containing protein [Ktedonobacterales bacterium]